MLGLAATSRWEASLVRERQKLYGQFVYRVSFMYCIHIHMVCALRAAKITFQKWME